MPERFNPRNHTGKTRKISGQWVFSNLCIILGWPVDPKKRKVTDSENELLGIHASLARFKHEDKIVFNPTEKRVREVLSDLRGYKSQGSLDPYEEVSLQGRLSFTLSTTYVRVGRATIQPLIDRSLSNAPKGNTRKKDRATNHHWSSISSKEKDTRWSSTQALRASPGITTWVSS
jgi:hypothetical protein